MPAPAAPTSLTFTQDATFSAPQGTLQWSHGGVDLHRFQVMIRKSGTTTWTNYGIYAATDLFVSGTTYRLNVYAPPGHTFLVRAMSSDGLVST